ncbi:T9SS type B sorting domain-containing protein [Flavobacterium pallidum]|uniref:T9SS type B sorting domain-containing protein n=1 Tax=Flavobacterium pallidum TaxID=2172098 RepID=A0A2S1SI29_9FLAO|nr:choice-of-anchor L domain-containing protein [Flavobacterium pallidum]AWI26066.1 hypothetical protein HYN49_09245 [Flavobacterium pallidum]
MNDIRKALSLGLLIGFATTADAQYITTDDHYTAQQLVEDVLVNSPCANVENFTVNGDTFNPGETSYAFFNGNGSSFPFANGIVLSTARANRSPGPNNNLIDEGSPDWAGDTDLEQALNLTTPTKNATVLEFDFTPLSNHISFDYIFASEEYHGTATCQYSDGFAFLLRPADLSEPYTNLAVIPNTNTPVLVTNIHPQVGNGTSPGCPAMNESYFGGFNGPDAPINFNGQTAVMTAESAVTPNVKYHIKLVIADFKNIRYDSAIFLGGGSFRVQKDLGEDRTMANGNPLCADGSNTAILDATEPGNNTYQWFRNNIAIAGATNPQFQPLQDGDYSVEITLNATACKSTGEIKIEFAAPLDESTVGIFQCDENNDGMAIFNLNKASDRILDNNPNVSFINYYEDASGTNLITTPQSYTSGPKTVYIKIANQYGCPGTVPIDLQIANNTVPVPPPFKTCDDDTDGLYHFNLPAEVTPRITTGLPAGLDVNYYLNPQDAAMGQNELSNDYYNTEAFQQQIWAAITNGPDCYGLIPVNLTVNIFPTAGMEDMVDFMCNGVAIPLEAPAGFPSYSWNDTANSTTRKINVDQPGTYIVTVTDTNGCTATKTFVVTGSEKATIDSVDIQDFRGDENTVFINASGSGDYEYSLDGQHYFDNPMFTNVVSGEYTVYVNDKHECGITTKSIFVMDYPKFFTPNNDGVNDYWQIPFLRLYPSSEVIIFDRYGKVVYGFSGNGSGWDGTLNSKPLPSTDYWFSISITNRIIRGHFALKR